MKISIKIISTEETYPLRKEILRKNIDKPFLFDGDFDTTTFHMAAFVDTKIIGIVTLMLSNNPLLNKQKQYQLRGMVISTVYQKQEVGSVLLNAVLQKLKMMHVDVVWCNARIKAIPFYSKQHFKKRGNLFDIPKIGKHIVMVKVL